MTMQTRLIKTLIRTRYKRETGRDLSDAEMASVPVLELVAATEDVTALLAEIRTATPAMVSAAYAGDIAIAKDACAKTFGKMIDAASR